MRVVSPITFLHLRMFPMAADYCKHSNSEYEVIGGYVLQQLPKPSSPRAHCEWLAKSCLDTYLRCPTGTRYVRCYGPGQAARKPALKDRRLTWRCRKLDLRQATIGMSHQEGLLGVG